MKKAFGTADVEKVCLIILKEGELQVSEKERRDEIEKVFKDIAAIIVEKCATPGPLSLNLLPPVPHHSR